jgi:FlaG/FlaF family flagellin (archaellin)
MRSSSLARIPSTSRRRASQTASGSTLLAIAFDDLSSDLLDVVIDVHQQQDEPS